MNFEWNEVNILEESEKYKEGSVLRLLDIFKVRTEWFAIFLAGRRWRRERWGAMSSCAKEGRSIQVTTMAITTLLA